MRNFFIIFFVVIIVFVCIAGVRGPEFHKFTSPPVEIFADMRHQPRFRPQDETTLFADGRSDRQSVPGTIPQDVPDQASYFATGKMGDHWGTGIPIPVTSALLERGQQRFNINCAICHGATAGGNGVTTKYGLVGVANLQLPQFQAYPDGQIFYTITHGKGQMGSYGQIKPEDRWAIVAYVRALQRARNGKLDELPETLRAQLK
jgi:mono/diheme cytochrome c family protein